MRASVARLDPVTVVACLLASLPLIIPAVRLLFSSAGYHLAGDGPLTEMAVRNAAHLHQDLGPYSRAFWAHPGPAWFYLLVPVYVLGGSNGASLLASQLVLQALAAVALVGVVGRWWGRGAALATATIVAWYVHALPDVFGELWNPYILPLPAILFLLLAAKAAVGSLPAMGWTVLIGSILVQSHIGTAVYVAAIGGLALAGCAVCRVRAARGGSGAGRRAWVLGLVGLSIAVIAWIPPLIQQFTSTNPNLTAVFRYFTEPQQLLGEGHQRWPGAVMITAHAFASALVGAPPDSITYRDLSVHGATWSLQPLAEVGAVALLAVALTLAGLRLRDRVAAALGALSLVGVVAAVYSVHHVVGPVFGYLVAWMSAPLVALAIGWSALLLRHRRILRQRLAVRFGRRAAAVGAARPAVQALGDRAARLPRLLRPLLRPVTLGVAVAAVAAAVAVPSQLAMTERHGNCCDSLGAATEDTVLNRALPMMEAIHDPSKVVALGIDSSQADRWWMATPILTYLDTRGWKVRPTQNWGTLWEMPYWRSAPVVVLLTSPTVPLPPTFHAVATFAAEGGVSTIAVGTRLVGFPA